MKSHREQKRISRFWFAGALCASTVIFQVGAARADVVHADDVIVQGSECIGFDCVVDENFGFDTIRLKENNLRIKFDDTSSTSGFPANDWEITINDSASGGTNKFSITDVTGAIVPFTVQAGAPSNSLFLNSSGKLGLGTSTPVLQFHITDGDTPDIRLEQTGNLGYTSQTWDVAGNEANFFVRDVTNGSLLPFRIKPGAPNNTLTLTNGGKVGIGTWSPVETLHVYGSSGSTKMQIEETSATQTARTLLSLKNKGNPMIEFVNTGYNSVWQLSAGKNFLLKDASNANLLSVDSSGNMTITGQITTSGTTCNGGCDAVFSDDQPVETIEEHAAKMWKNSSLPAVGPTKENQPFNLTAKTGGMLNELEKAHIYIDQLNKRLSEREAQLDKLAKRIDELEKRR